MNTRLRVFTASACVAAALLLFTPHADATVMVEVTLEDMVRDSDAIVRGVVQRTGVQLVLRDGDADPHSLAWVRVDEWLKGPGGDEVIISELGGEHAMGGMWIAGTPTYQTGEEVIVFLRRDPMDQSRFRTYGMAQGKFVVRRGVPGTSGQVERDVSSVGFARWANGQMHVEHGENGPAMPLQAFEQLIRQTVPLGGATDLVGGAR